MHHRIKLIFQLYLVSLVNHLYLQYSKIIIKNQNEKIRCLRGYIKIKTIKRDTNYYLLKNFMRNIGIQSQE